jgi:hypothetical protein
MAASLGGSVWYEDSKDSSGSVFCLSVPMGSYEAENEEQQPLAEQRVRVESDSMLDLV